MAFSVFNMMCFPILNPKNMLVFTHSIDQTNIMISLLGIEAGTLTISQILLGVLLCPGVAPVFSHCWHRHKVKVV